jgi:hypothetical protein
MFSVQVLTSVLLSTKDLTAVEYGTAAHQKYLEMEDCERKNYVLLERFKMCLQRVSTEGESLTVEAVNGTSVPALRVHTAARAGVPC